MRYGLQRTTSPINRVVTVDEAKKQLEIAESDNTHDAHLDSLILAATERCESATNRQLLTAAYQLTLDEFPSGCELYMPKGKLQSVDAISYTDVDGASQAFTGFSSVTSYEPGVLYNTSTWPTTKSVPGAVTITFQAGYGTDAEDVPDLLRRGILMLVTHYFENREPVVVGVAANEVPESITAIFDSFHIGDSYHEYGV